MDDGNDCADLCDPPPPVAAARPSDSAAVDEAALEALRTGQRTAVSLPDRPEFYAK